MADTIKIYPTNAKPKPKGPRLPALTLRHDLNGDVDLIAVDPDTGEPVASLLWFDARNGSLWAYARARGNLERAGFHLPGAGFNSLGAIGFSVD